MKSFSVLNYTIEIFGDDTVCKNLNASQDYTKSVIYVPCFEGEGQALWETLNLQIQPVCVLVCISGMDWNLELSPWQAPAIKGSCDFGGGADTFLRTLTDLILPQTEQLLSFQVTDRGIAGYSMAGLFSVYAMYRTALFNRIGSVSGSLWFDNFACFCKTHQIYPKEVCIYISLGSREHRASNFRMRAVKEQTEHLVCLWQPFHPVCYETNPGGHFDDPTGRMVRAIQTLCTMPLRS